MKRMVPAALALALICGAAQAEEGEANRDEGKVRRVLLLSVDGLHRQDLARWVKGHPGSALARLSRSGVTYSAAKAPTPSDSVGYLREPALRGTKGSKEDQKGFFLRGQAGGVTNAVHTASDIPISVYSTGSDAWKKFVGVQKNTDVFFKAMEAALSGGQED